MAGPGGLCFECTRTSFHWTKKPNVGLAIRHLVRVIDGWTDNVDCIRGNSVAKPIDKSIVGSIVRVIHDCESMHFVRESFSLLVTIMFRYLHYL